MCHNAPCWFESSDLAQLASTCNVLQQWHFGALLRTIATNTKQRTEVVALVAWALYKCVLMRSTYVRSTYVRSTYVLNS